MSGKSPSDLRRRKQTRGMYADKLGWKMLVELCGNVCARCHLGGKLTRDHVTPLKLGGSNGLLNLQPLCVTCNGEKGLSVIDYRAPELVEAIKKKLPDWDRLTFAEKRNSLRSIPEKFVTRPWLSITSKREMLKAKIEELS